MITEDYVSFEVAKLLKEKGFNERICHYYDEDGFLHCDTGLYFCNSLELSNDISAPTLQMARKWLREVYGYVIVVEPGLSGGKYVWTYKVILCRTRTILLQHEDNVGSSTYEEAVEVALKHCLNLI